MSLQVTPAAAAILRRSLELGSLDPARHGVRLRVTKPLGGGADVQVELAEDAEGTQQVLETQGIRLFVDPAVQELYPDALVTVEPQHDIVVVRPA